MIAALRPLSLGFKSIVTKRVEALAM